MKKKMKEYCLVTKDYKQRKVYFSEDNRKKHALKHPELDDEDFVCGRVGRAIREPEFIYEALNDKKKAVSYLLEYMNGSTPVYTKVVIKYNDKLNIGYVASAWRMPYVKERGKTKLIYGEDK